MPARRTRRTGAAVYGFAPRSWAGLIAAAAADQAVGSVLLATIRPARSRRLTGPTTDSTGGTRGPARAAA